MSDIRDILGAIFLFDGLNPDQLNQVARIATTQSLAKGEMLFAEGDPAAAFYGITSGQVKIHRMTEAGAEFTLHIHNAGDLVAEAAIFDLKRYPAYCTALEDTRLVRIPSADFVDLIHKQPDLALSVMQSYSKRLRQFVRALADFSLGDVKSRLANYFLRNAADRNGRMVCTLDISKRELASLLGTVPETLSRSLRALKDAGIVEEQGSDITILQPGKLKAMVQTK